MTSPLIHPAGALALPGFVYDFDAHELRTDGGARVALRPQCLSVLRCLALRAGQAVDKDELMRTVWGNVVVTDDSLVQCIRALRDALGDHERRVVQTEPRRGYRLVALRDESDAMPTVRQAVPQAPEFLQDVRFVQTDDGVRIAYATTGRGMPLVRTGRWISHLDFDAGCLTEGPLLAHLARTSRFVRYDRRGQGLSDRDAAIGTMEDQQRDLKAVVDAAGVSRAVFVGIGTGIAIAIRFAIQHPDRVSGLILIAGYVRGAFRRGERSLPIGTGRAYARLFEDDWDDDNPIVRQMVSSRHYPAATLEQWASHNEMLRRSCSGRMAADVIRAEGDLDVTGDLPRVRCPTLVAHSPNDAATPYEEGRLIAASIPGARLLAFDSPNHIPLPGEPAFHELTSAIDRFIADVETARPRKNPLAAHGAVLRLAPSAASHVATDSPSAFARKRRTD